MNDLFSSPVGALLARPWVDQAGLIGLRRWYWPLSRLWAAANAAGQDSDRFRREIGTPLPVLWSDARLRGLLIRHGQARARAEAARTAWETAIFDRAGPTAEPGQLDRRRRLAATRHLATRGWFYPLLFPRRPPAAQWRIASPERMRQHLGEGLTDPRPLYRPAIDSRVVEASSAFVRNGGREYWLRAPTPSVRLADRPGSETLYARIVEPAHRAPDATLIFGSGLCLELDLLAVARDPATRLANLGWRVIEPVSPYHGLRAMEGYYGGEPFLAAAPASSLDLVTGQVAETALLAAWCRARFGGKVAVAGISMTSFVAQQVASYCHLWPAEARPDAAMLISHSGRMANVAFDGALTAALGLDRALSEAGWSREAMACLSHAVDPAPSPALPASRIVSVLGETDRWLSYGDGLAVARRWKLPDANVFRYRLGHLGMPVQLARDAAPFERLRQVLAQS